MTGSTSQSACLPAPAGNYASGTGNDGFTPCDPGTYQNQPGKATCKDCPPGYACPAGSVNPLPCSKGFYADLKQPWCKECPKGTYQDKTAQRACKPCPAGAYCAATKMAAPTPCPAGRFGIKFSSATANDCAKCPINVSSSRAVDATPRPDWALVLHLTAAACSALAACTSTASCGQCTTGFRHLTNPRP